MLSSPSAREPEIFETANAFGSGLQSADKLIELRHRFTDDEYDGEDEQDDEAPPPRGVEGLLCGYNRFSDSLRTKSVGPLRI